jgi:two-component system OmpR family response regulator
MNAAPIPPPAILVIDDEPWILDIIRTVLELEGYAVHTAAHPIAAVELYAKHWPGIGLVILDFLMPEMRGDQLAVRLQQINPAVRFLVVSGSAGEIRADMFGGSLRGYLAKPFRLEHLVRQVQHALDGDHR